MELVNNKYKRISHVGEVAKELDISYGMLRKVFARDTGFTLNWFLHFTKVEKSKPFLLYHPKKKLYTVAKEVGYPDEATLIRHFKAVYGVTPTEFRNAYFTPEAVSAQSGQNLLPKSDTKI